MAAITTSISVTFSDISPEELAALLAVHDKTKSVSIAHFSAEPEAATKEKRPTPEELIKRGYVVRGPYDANGVKVYRLVDPANQTGGRKYNFVAHKFDFKRLKAMAAPNEKNVRKAGRQPKPKPTKELKSGHCSLCTHPGIMGRCSECQELHCSDCHTNQHVGGFQME